MGIFRESIANSTLHALPIAVTTPNRGRKLFWIVTFLIAGIIVALHSYKITTRFLEAEIVTSSREYSPDTIVYPDIYARLVDADVGSFNFTEDIGAELLYYTNHTIRETTVAESIFKLNGLVKVGESRIRSFTFDFCVSKYVGVRGSIQLFDPLKNNSYNPLGLLNYDLQQSTTVLEIMPTYYRMLPPPHSKCSEEYPGWMFPMGDKVPFSHIQCALNCAVLKYSAQSCHCSPRRVIHFESVETVNLPNCPSNSSSACTIESMWLNREIQSKLAIYGTICDRSCSDECFRTEFKPTVTYSMNGDNGWCSRYYRKWGSLILQMNQRIRTHYEQVEYPISEYLSELIGILGAYLGISICTFAEFLEMAVLVAKPFLKKLGYRAVFQGCFEDADDIEFNKSTVPFDSPITLLEKKGKLAHDNRQCSLVRFKLAGIESKN